MWWSCAGLAGFVDIHCEPQELSQSACTIIRAGHSELCLRKPMVHEQMGVSSQYTLCELLPHHLAASFLIQTLRVNLEANDAHMDNVWMESVCSCWGCQDPMFNWWSSRAQDELVWSSVHRRLPAEKLLLYLRKRLSFSVSKIAWDSRNLVREKGKGFAKQRSPLVGVWFAATAVFGLPDFLKN